MGGQTTGSKKDQSILAGFTYRAIAASCVAVVALTSLFALATYLIHGAEESRRARAFIKSVAGRIEPGAGGDLTASVGAICMSDERVVAVGTTDSLGQHLLDLYPPNSPYRAAASKALAARSEPMPLEVALGEDMVNLWGAVASAVEDESLFAQRLVVLVRRNEGAAQSIGALATFAGLALLIQAGFLVLCAHWVKYRVAMPLLKLATEEKARRRKSDKDPEWEFREFDKLYRRIETLKAKLLSAEEEQDGLEMEYQQKLIVQAQKSRKALQRAESQAKADALTGVKNRSFLESDLEKIYLRQKACDADLSLVLLDIDHFKELNDSSGHEAGDEMLRFLGELLRATIRATDHAVRYGGDEFVLLLADTSAKEARQITERIVRLFAQFARTKPSPLPVTISAGVASLKASQCSNAKELLAEADSVLYAVKRNGKNGVAAVHAA